MKKIKFYFSRWVRSRLSCSSSLVASTVHKTLKWVYGKLSLTVVVEGTPSSLGQRISSPLSSLFVYEFWFVEINSWLQIDHPAFTFEDLRDLEQTRSVPVVEVLIKIGYHEHKPNVKKFFVVCYSWDVNRPLKVAGRESTMPLHLWYSLKTPLWESSRGLDDPTGCIPLLLRWSLVGPIWGLLAAGVKQGK